MNKLFWCFCFWIIATAVNGQQLILQGKIVYERKEHMHKLIDEEMASEESVNTWWVEMRKIAPKYRIDQFELNFNTSQSLYQMVVEDEQRFNQQWYRVAYNNKVLTDFKTGRTVSDKTVYEKDYRVEDTVKTFQWKITNEYREVAGRNCRKATTILFDSVYVIAFYTEEIPVSGGPEQFTGLPGMILGIVIPRIHYTLFATQVQTQLLPEKDLQLGPMSRRRELTNRAQFDATMQKAFKDWGKDAIKVFWRTEF